jgi:hypothetical protein
VNLIRNTEPDYARQQHPTTCDRIKTWAQAQHRNSKMAQRWLGSVLLYTEKTSRSVKGREHIQTVLANIEAERATISAS